MYQYGGATRPPACTHVCVLCTNVCTNRQSCIEHCVSPMCRPYWHTGTRELMLTVARHSILIWKHCTVSQLTYQIQIKFNMQRNEVRWPAI